MSIFSHRSRYFSRRRLVATGFTLVEMLVVVSIMVIITGLLLFRQSRFDSATLLRSLGYSVALSIRQAQVYGSSVLGTPSAQAACSGGFYSNSNCYATAYGIYVVQPAGSPAPAITTYTLFADLDNDSQFDSGEEVKVFSLGNGYTISDFKATTVGASPVTRSLSGGEISSLTILFKRPNPDALFKTSITTDTYASAYLQLQSQGDTTNTRSVSIYSTGQISVGAPGS